ncbi:MAG: HisA/HisF-related TIM barrel protein [Pirellulaceae bacterium]
MLDRVLAVIDLQRGRAVRGIAGQRERYRPVFFDQTDWSDPLALGRFYLAQRVGGVYVADLDALTGGAMQVQSLARFIELDCPLWIDAGICGVPEEGPSRHLLQSQHVHWILATESFGFDRESSLRWLEELPAERLTVSIDMMHGKLLTPASAPGANRQTDTDMGGQGEPSDAKARQAIDFFYSLGFRSFLILDLACVGGGAGPGAIEFCRAVRTEFAGIQLISGGGVRDGADLAQLFAAGVDYALVASALQNRAIFAHPQAAKD